MPEMAAVRRIATVESTRQRRASSWVESVARLVLSPLVLPRWAAERFLDALVPLVVAEVLRRVDLTALIIRHVDLDRVVAQVNLADLVADVLDAIDLPEILRESTSSVVSDSVRRVRLGGIAADEAVGRVRNQLLRRPTGA
jgi:hypothetical protein